MSKDNDFGKEKAMTLASLQQTHTMSLEDRRALGEEARRQVPLEAHAQWIPLPNRTDPVDLLIASSEGRIEELIEIRHGRMLADPFAFYRGSAAIMAYDLSHTPNSGFNVQACGDCHLLNFGGFATPERNIIFDINDFDETSIAPWEWDVKRLAASFVIAGRSNNFTAEENYRAAWMAAESYREHIARISRMPVLDTWYETINLDEILDNAEDPEIVHFYRKKLMKAAKQSAHEKEFARLAHEAGKPARIIDQPPLIFHYGDLRDKEFHESVDVAYANYKKSLSPELHLLLDRYKIDDVAFKVVGVGSVGTLCGIALLMSAGEPLFLQFKQAGRSVLEPYAGASPYAHGGKRVVIGQRLMQSATDMFLGWSYDEMWQRQIYVRQLRDAKIKPVVSAMRPKNLHNYAKLCGQALAQAHSRSGDAVILSAYMGVGESFADAFAAFAVTYTDQNEKDYKAILNAEREGLIEVQREE